MDIRLESDDHPVTVFTQIGGKTIKLIICADKDELSVKFLKTSVDGLQMNVAHPEVRIPAYDRGLVTP